MMRILVVTLSNLGDVVLTLPVFESLARAFGDCRIDVIVGKPAAELFNGHPRIGKVTVYEKRSSWAQKTALLRAVRSERYDLIIDLKYSMLGLLGGARRRNRYFRPKPKKAHKALVHLSALDGIAPAFAGRGFLRVAERGPDAKLILAAVGSKSSTKIWPSDYFARVLDRLALQDGYEIKLIGSAAERPEAQAVMDHMTAPALDLTGQTPLPKLVDMISRASLVITNDSAPLHISDALGVPTVALFGPTDPRKYGPRDPRSLVAKKTLFCAPCEKAQCRFQRECLTELMPDSVYRQAKQILTDEFQPRNIKLLAIRLDRIGDVVLSLPALEAIKQRFPNSTLAVMTREETRALLEGHPLVDEVIVYRYHKKGRHHGLLGNIRFMREIAKRRFDIAFVLRPAPRAHFVPFLAGIPYRVGLECGLSSLTLTKRVRDRRHEGTRHESETTLDIVRAFGIETGPDLVPRLPVYADTLSSVQKKLHASGVSIQEPFLVFHAGASCISKRWPAERFAALGRTLTERHKMPVVIVGGAAERTASANIQHAVGERASDLTGRISLPELAALLSKAKLLVSNDSGPVHIAAAVGTPTLTIFGRNRSGLSPVRWRALGPGHRQVQKDVGCVECLAHLCPIDFECLKAVSVDEVARQAAEMLTAT